MMNTTTTTVTISGADYNRIKEWDVNTYIIFSQDYYSQTQVYTGVTELVPALEVSETLMTNYKPIFFVATVDKVVEQTVNIEGIGCYSSTYKLDITIYSQE